MVMAFQHLEMTFWLVVKIQAWIGYRYVQSLHLFYLQYWWIFVSNFLDPPLSALVVLLSQDCPLWIRWL